MRVLITGGTGFVGSHLIDQYVGLGNVEVVATKRRRSDLSNVRGVYDSVRWVDVDIIDSYAVGALIQDLKPDVIHHLAALSFVRASWDAPVETMSVNVLGSMYLFEAVRRYSPDSIVHIASTSEVYGVPKTLPITEEALPVPVSPYGVSKLAMDRLAVQYHRSYGLHTVITRGFNHTGPRRGESFVLSSFAKQIALSEASGGPLVIQVGDLSSKRDFTDVRDMCVAYRCSVRVRYGEPYNVSSGYSISMQDALNQLLALSRITDFKIQQDESRMRPSDIPDLVGDSSKFRQATGWRPSFQFSTTLSDLLEYWRRRVSDESIVCHV